MGNKENFKFYPETPRDYCADCGRYLWNDPNCGDSTLETKSDGEEISRCGSCSNKHAKAIMQERERHQRQPNG